jgi:hypothetical protein
MRVLLPGAVLHWELRQYDRGRERYGLEMAADGLLCFRAALDKGLWE